MMKALLMILDLDGYTNLYNKFHDNSSLSYGEHHWVSKVWRTVMYEMIKTIQIRKAWAIRKAWYNNDWDTMYEIILEWWQIEDVELIAEF